MTRLGWNAAVITYTPKAVRVATAAALPAYTQAGAGVGATLTMDAVGVVTIDGAAIVLNDRIFLTDTHAVATKNAGIYKCTTEGTAGVAAIFTRATDFDAAAAGEIEKGAAVRPTAGTANIGKTYVLTTAAAITVDTTALAFAEYASGVALDTRYSLPLALWPNITGISANVSLVNTAALDGDLSIEVVNATASEIEQYIAGTLTLPWFAWQTISDLSGLLTISSLGLITIDGTVTEFPIQLNNCLFTHLRFKWAGTLGVGTISLRVSTKETS